MVPSNAKTTEAASPANDTCYCYLELVMKSSAFSPGDSSRMIGIFVEDNYIFPHF